MQIRKLLLFNQVVAFDDCRVGKVSINLCVGGWQNLYIGGMHLKYDIGYFLHFIIYKLCNKMCSRKRTFLKHV